jgi:dual specificity protein kinase YAK1
MSTNQTPPQSSTTSDYTGEHLLRKRKTGTRKKRRQPFEDPQTLQIQAQIPYGKPSYIVIEPSSVFIPYVRPQKNEQEGATQISPPSKQNSNKSLLTLEVIGDTNAQSPKSNKTYPSQNILKSLTVGITLKYKLCSADFKYTNPKLVLTKPSTPSTENNGKDNIDGNLILTVDDMLNDRYCVKDVLGCGTFGQVARCEDTKDGGKQVAVKIIKNKRAYLKQAEVETHMLQILSQHDPEDKHHIIRMHGYFYYENHLCIVTELLSINLFDLIKQNRFRGLTTNVISVFLSQILDALVVLADAHIIHCDLKPENILLTNLSSSKNLIKIIDFGSACFENETVYSYIQSRFYRSPEVLFGLEYNTAIDMWSLGCICAELFLGLPLFPGVSQYNQVCRLVEMLGLPPDHLIENGKFSHKYFKAKRTKQTGDPGLYELKTEEEYCRENNQEPKEWKRYFNYTQLDDLIKHYSMKNVPPDTRHQEEKNRIAFIDLLRGLLQWDPNKRWTARQAKLHPFVTGQPYTEPFVPEPDPSKVPMTLRRHGTQVSTTHQQHCHQPYQPQFNPSYSHLTQSSGAPYFTPPFNNGYLPSPGSFMSSSGFIGPNLGPSPNTAFFQTNMEPVNIGSNNTSGGGIPIQGSSYHHQPMHQNLMNSPGSYGQWNMMPHMYGTPSAQYQLGSSPYVPPSHHTRQRSGSSHLAQPNVMTSPGSLGTSELTDSFQNMNMGSGGYRGKSKNNEGGSYKKNGYMGSNYNQQSMSAQTSGRRQSYKQFQSSNEGTPQSSPHNTSKPPKHPLRGKTGNSFGSGSYNKSRFYQQESIEKQTSPSNVASGEISPDVEGDLFEFDEEQQNVEQQSQLRKQPQQYQPHNSNNPYYNSQQPQQRGRKGSQGGYPRQRGNSGHDFALYGGSMGGTDIIYGASPGGLPTTGLLGSSYSSSSLTVPSSVNSSSTEPYIALPNKNQYSQGSYEQSPQTASSLLSSSFSNETKPYNKQQNRHDGRYRSNK